MNHAYLFEAHTIQPYILESGKLPAMVGASEILEEIISENGPLDMVLKQLFPEHKTDPHYCFARRGGGAFFLLFSDPKKAQQLKQVWSLIVAGIAPGLAYSHACSDNASSQHEAIESAKKIIHQQRNQLVAEIPEATPWVRRSPRTGNAAVTMINEKGKAKVWADKATVVKFKQRYAKGEKLSKKFLIQGLGQQFKFPLNLEHDPDEAINTSFPFNTDNHNIGIIHADGNGLGQILIKLAQSLDKTSDQYASVFYELSKKIDKATQSAARKALGKVIEQRSNNIIPARPIILGGDDLTIIVRADLALEYASDFITFFEQETKIELKSLHKKYKEIPPQMTACAGIAFIKSNQPFSLAYALAESLCDAAKKRSRQHINDMIPGSFAFHRVTSSFIDQYNEALKRELTITQRINGLETELQLTLGAYGAGEFSAALPQFHQLEKLKELFTRPDMSKGPTREFLTLLAIDKHEAQDRWDRWRKVMKKTSQHNLDDYDNYAKALIPHDATQLPFISDKEAEGEKRITFIGDLINWIAATGEQANEKNRAEEANDESDTHS